MYRSLCFFFILATTAYATRIEPQPHLDLIEKCKKEVKIENRTISLNLTIELELAETDRDIRCFLACRSREQGMINELGVLNHESVLGAFPKGIAGSGKAKDAIKACANQTHTDFCDNAYQTMKCLLADKRIMAIRPRNLSQTEDQHGGFIRKDPKQPHVI